MESKATLMLPPPLADGVTILASTNATRKSTRVISDLSLRKQYFCRKCNSHGITVSVKGHKKKCSFKDCTCGKCSLVDYGRLIVAKQISNYRKQRSEDMQVERDRLMAMQLGPDLSAIDAKMLPKMHVLLDNAPHCRRCRNHGLTQLWKGHKKHCPYANCICEDCQLIALRKSNDKTLREENQQNSASRAAACQLLAQQYQQHLLPQQPPIVHPVFPQDEHQLQQHSLQHMQNPHTEPVIKPESSVSTFDGSSTDAGNASSSSEIFYSAIGEQHAGVPDSVPATYPHPHPLLDLSYGQHQLGASSFCGAMGHSQQSYACGDLPDMTYCAGAAPYQHYYQSMQARYSCAGVQLSPAASVQQVADTADTCVQHYHQQRLFGQMSQCAWQPFPYHENV